MNFSPLVLKRLLLCRSSKPLCFLIHTAAMALYSTASAAYGSLKSPQECINAIPMTFCDQLRPEFLELADIHEKHHGANKILQSLRKRNSLKIKRTIGLKETR